MLITTTDGVINTDHVARVEHLPTGATDRCKVTFRDGTTSVLRVGFDTFEETSGVIVPAQPGFAVITAYMPHPSDNRPVVTFDEEAVIAFRVGSHGNMDPFPITLTGEPRTSPSVRWTVVQPNGRCCNPDTTHDSLDAFKAECERAAVARLAAAA